MMEDGRTPFIFKYYSNDIYAHCYCGIRMDNKFKISDDIISNYRNYYKYGKSHLHNWKFRDKPNWI